MGAQEAGASLATLASEVVSRATALGQDQNLGIIFARVQERIQKFTRCIEQYGIGAGLDQMAH